jgi:hypothetical protein
VAGRSQRRLPVTLSILSPISGTEAPPNVREKFL